MEKKHKIALGVFALILIVAFIATGQHVIGG